MLSRAKNVLILPQDRSLTLLNMKYAAYTNLIVRSVRNSTLDWT